MKVISLPTRKIKLFCSFAVITVAFICLTGVYHDKEGRLSSPTHLIDPLTASSLPALEIKIKEELPQPPVGKDPPAPPLSFSKILLTNMNKTKPKDSGQGQNVPAYVKPLLDLHASQLSSSSKFSPEALRKRALSFSNTYGLQAFLTEQDRRADHVAQTCLSIPTSMHRGYSPNFAEGVNLVVDKKHQIAFCPVYKSGSTSWASTLIEIAGYPYSEMSQTLTLQDILKKVFPRVLMSSAPTLTRSMTRFIVVRHPFERLLSCYRDKYQNASKPWYYNRYGEKMVRTYRKFPENLSFHQLQELQQQVNHRVMNHLPVVLPGNPFAEPVGPTFPEFVQYVVNNYEDEHWRNYNSHCSPCLMNYQFILRSDNMEEEGKQFIEYLNQTSQVNTRWENPTEGESTTNRVACFYYNQLTLETIKKLAQKYELDFKLFEYKPEVYFQCANNYEYIDEIEPTIPVN